MTEIIDAHHHLWHYVPEDYGWISLHMSVLRQDFLPETLRLEKIFAGVAGSVVVQARQTLEETEWLHLKTRDSAADITVDPEVMAELSAFKRPTQLKPQSWSQFVLQSTHAPKPNALRPYYRAADTFDRLNTWLRGKGIRANKPLHELRKEVGAVIATEQGIYAASKFLRHSDITTTARHYADQKARINVGLGKFLDEN